MAVPTYASFLLRIGPPWLQRAVGERFMLALGSELDVLYERGRQSIKQRFPAVVDETSLGRIGAERRIRRGPGESAETYARRLRRWWDDHRRRGGPYALLAQLYSYFVASLNPRIDVVYHSGTRRWIPGGVEVDDPDELVTRDSITWEADGTDEWAQFWVFFHLGTLINDVFVNEDGDVFVDENGDPIVAESSTLSDAEAAVFLAIVREWNAAHIKRAHVVLLVEGSALVGYPPRLVGEPGETVGRLVPPIILPPIED
jgi:hypothetical protein